MNVKEFNQQLERLATLSGEKEYRDSLGVQEHIYNLIKELKNEFALATNKTDELLKGKRFFKAKPLKNNIDPAFDDPDDVEWWEEYLDNEGYIHGWYSDGYIIGHVIEADDEYIIHEFWCAIDKSTLQLGKKVGKVL